MAVATKKTAGKAAKKAPARRVAPKVVEPVVETPETNEARIAARERNVESRKRAEAELGVGKSASRVEIYRIKNRKTGEVRILIDARGDADSVEAPWVVTNEDGSAEVGYATRKELGENYAHVDLSPKPAPKARGRRVKK